MAERKYYKAINFDLKIESLRHYYSQKHPKQAYREIKKYLISNGFSHRQWSGYRSKNRLSDYDIISLVDEMFEKFPWLEHCATRFDVTNIGRTYDLLSIRLADKNAEMVTPSPLQRESYPVSSSPKPEPQRVKTKLRR